MLEKSIKLKTTTFFYFLSCERKRLPFKHDTMYSFADQSFGNHKKHASEFDISKTAVIQLNTSLARLR